MKIQKCLGMTAAAVALLIAMPASADEKRGQLSETDFKFATEAARESAKEVLLGKLAKEKATNQKVKDFAAKMVDDHSKAASELKTVLSSKGATLPLEPTGREKEHTESLQKATGKDFDSAYAEHMVKDHKKTIKEFEKAATDLTDAELKAYAQKQLPILQEHLRLAEEMEANLKKEA